MAVNVLNQVYRFAIPTAVAFSLASASLYDVKGGTRAVIFDRLRGVSDQVVNEGTHFLVPWLQKAITFDVRTKPRNIRNELIGPLDGSKMNCITTPTMAVVVTTGRKNTVRNSLDNGSFGELSTMASRKLKSTRAGATSNMKRMVILNELQNSGSSKTDR